MGVLSQDQIERRVDQVLKVAGVEGNPVPVEEVAETCGASVRYEHSRGEVSGALYRRGKAPIIGVNARHSKTRQRFTIAHEIGHLRLHDDEIHIDRRYPVELPGNSARKAPRFFRKQHSCRATDPKEVEANRFAAALLMPIRFLKKSVRGLEAPLIEADITRLAGEYKVSVQAMTFRLANLGVPVDIDMTDWQR